MRVRLLLLATDASASQDLWTQTHEHSYHSDHTKPSRDATAGSDASFTFETVAWASAEDVVRVSFG